MWTREDEGLDGFAMLEVERASRLGSSGDHGAKVYWLFENSEQVFGRLQTGPWQLS